MWDHGVLQQRSSEAHVEPLPEFTDCHVSNRPPVLCNQREAGPSMPLSPLARAGTSTWTYEGWQGQVYTRPYAKSKFARDCLGEYCQYQYQGEPLFRTVGNGSTFYRPPTANELRRYLNQIPRDFEMCFKVWEEITIPSYANQPRYGPRA